MYLQEVNKNLVSCHDILFLIRFCRLQKTMKKLSSSTGTVHRYDQRNGLGGLMPASCHLLWSLNTNFLNTFSFLIFSFLSSFFLTHNIFTICFLDTLVLTIPDIHCRHLTIGGLLCRCVCSWMHCFKSSFLSFFFFFLVCKFCGALWWVHIFIFGFWVDITLFYLINKIQELSAIVPAREKQTIVRTAISKVQHLSGMVWLDECIGQKLYPIILYLCCKINIII